MDNKTLPELCSDEICTGCMACANICPVSAIEVKQNDEGFYRPAVSADKCIGCKKCEHTCPVINPPIAFNEVDHVYAAWHKNENIRLNSSSGGAVSALAQAILDENGIVAGAAYTDNLHIRHIIISEERDLEKLRLSKYAQSDIGLCYKEIKKKLDEGRPVLFCGTPCQAAGIRKFIGEKYDNLIVCDFICHGVPSPLMLQKYTDWINKKYQIVTQNINFRDKRKGWYDALRVVKSNGKEYVLKGKYDSYWIGFNYNLDLQLSCYDCRFLGLRRFSDITIADFWGLGTSVPFEHKDQIEKGISMIMCNSSKGFSLFQRSIKNLNAYERDTDEIVKTNKAIIQSSTKPKIRDNFYKELKNSDFDSFINKSLKPDFKTKIVKIMREYLPLSLIKIIRMKNLK